MKGISAIILAAGQGKRMKSSLPKVAHLVLGKPVVWHVAQAARAAGIREMVFVLGYGRDKVLPVVEGVRREGGDPGEPVRNGGRGPVRPGRTFRGGEGSRGALRGRPAPPARDDPRAPCGPPPAGGPGIGADGRSRRPDRVRPDRSRRRTGSVARIVEEKDANAVLRKVREVNSGTYAFDRVFLERGVAAPLRRERPAGILPDGPRPRSARRREARGPGGGGGAGRSAGDQLPAGAGRGDADPPGEEARRPDGVRRHPGGPATDVRRDGSVRGAGHGHRSGSDPARRDADRPGSADPDRVRGGRTASSRTGWR